MVLNPRFSTSDSWDVLKIHRKDAIFPQSTSLQRENSHPYSSPEIPPPQESQGSKISPAILFSVVILTVIFFVSGLLHLLVRFLIKKQPPSSTSQSNGHPHHATEIASSEALQRQLQQLFSLHDSGLDQTFIDELPIFPYKDIVGAKEPFDCAVCLCEFSSDDKLRLLPLCGHAFHLNCIDTWLLSNSTCPLCRGALFVPGLAIENPIFEFDSTTGEDEPRFSCNREEDGITGEKWVFSIRLGKFKNVSERSGNVTQSVNATADGLVKHEQGEASNSNLDARRCYSMGSYQYVLGDTNLCVPLASSSKRFVNVKYPRAKPVSGGFRNTDDLVGKRICAASKGDSFSVSKIWQWSNNKGKQASGDLF